MPLGHDLRRDGAARRRRARGWCSSPIRTIRPAPGSTRTRCDAFLAARAATHARRARRSLLRVRRATPDLSRCEPLARASFRTSSSRAPSRRRYGLAGLRVGYAMSQPRVADMLNRVRQPFNVNSLALAAARRALDDSEQVQRAVRAESRRHGSSCSAGCDALGVRHLPSARQLRAGRSRPAGGAGLRALLRQGVIVRPLRRLRPAAITCASPSARGAERAPDRRARRRCSSCSRDDARYAGPAGCAAVSGARCACPATSRSRIAR